MNTLKAGFARVNINPPLGTRIGGYFILRYAEHILDDIEVNAIALEAGGQQVLLMAMDQCGCETDIVTRYRAHVSQVTGVPMENIFISNTHSHTTPFLLETDDEPLQKEYSQFLCRRMGDAAKFALADLKDARMGWATGKTMNITHVRRYRMRDGSVRTNPGFNNPDVLGPTSYADERVNVLRFDREGGETIVLANYGNHPDTIGGNNISADWPGVLRRTVEQTIDNTRCVFFNGTEGDVGTTSALAKGGALNNMILDFDNVYRGYSHTLHMGRTVAGAVLQVYDKVNYVDVDRLATKQKWIKAPSNMPKPEELELAKKYHELHTSGRDDLIPFKAMDLTTVVAEARRMVMLEHGPEFFDLMLSGLAIGPVALIGLPGEPFDGVGRALKQAEGWEVVLPCSQINGKEGYFPMQQTYEEGGYETRSSKYKPGIAELLIEAGTDVLNELHN